MDEDTEATWNDGDIVWVKLGPCWWPGEVKDVNNLPKEVLDFKKPPLAIVKFFEEDKYEYVRNPTKIHPYNFDQKNDFIKKGLHSTRAKVPNLNKFKSDIIAAEIKTGGNPNILMEPQFLPEKKINYVAEIFGSPSPRKSSSKKNRLSGKSLSNDILENITHRRFLGWDDFESHICIQYPGKDREPASDDDEVMFLNKEPEKTYDCPSCSFTTTRIEVMVEHSSSHSNGLFVELNNLSKKKKKKSLGKKGRKPKVQKTISDFDLSSDEVEMKSQKRKPKSQGSSKKLKQKKVEEKPPVENLLAEWDDDDSEEEGNTTLDNTAEKVAESSFELDNTFDFESLKESKKPNKEDKIVEKEVVEAENVAEKPKKVDDKTVKTSDVENSKSPMAKDMKEAIKSCFDFEEEEEEESSIVSPAAIGRKIPRVIPDKRESKELDEVIDADLPTKEDDVNRTEIIKDSENCTKSSSSVAAIEEDKFEETFKELMETTAVPNLPDEVNNTLKCEQNFHSGKTIKFPDKSDSVEAQKVPSPQKTSEKSKEAEVVATKLTNPKKRFVKSFEDFEQFMSEQRRLEEKKTAEIPAEDTLVSPLGETSKDISTCPATEETKQISPAPVEKETRLSKQIVKKISESHKDFDKKPTGNRRSSRFSASKNYELAAAVLTPPTPVSLEIEEQLEIIELKNKIMSKIIKESESVPSKMRRLGSGSPQVTNLDNKTDTSKRKSTEETKTEASIKPVEEIIASMHDSPPKEMRVEENQKFASKREKLPPKKNIWSSKTRYSTPKRETKFSSMEENLNRRFFTSRRDLRSAKPPFRPQESPRKPPEALELSVIEPEASTPKDNFAKSDNQKDIPTGEFLHKKEDPPKEIVEECFQKKEESPKEIEDLFKKKEEPPKEIEEFFAEKSQLEIEEPIQKNEELLLKEPPNDTQTDLLKKLLPQEQSEEKFSSSVESPEKTHLTTEIPEETPLVEESPKELPLNSFNDIREVSSEVAPLSLMDVETTPILHENTLSEVEKDDETMFFPKNDSVLPEEIISQSQEHSVNVSTIEAGETLQLPMEEEKQTIVEEKEPIVEKKELIIAEKEPIAEENESATVVEKEPIVKDKKHETLVEEIISNFSEAEISNEPKNVVNFQENTEIASHDEIAEEKVVLDEFSVQENTSNAVAHSEVAENAEILPKNDVLETTEVIASEEIVDNVGVSVENNTVFVTEEIPSATKSLSDEIVFQLASSDIKDESSISIKTNLSNLSKVEEMSALTLATLSQIKLNTDPPEIAEKVPEIDPAIQVDPIHKIPPIGESELVHLEGNPTVVSEKDLADGQVEITASSNKKHVTLMNFSMDFSESNSDSNPNSESDLLKNDYEAKSFSHNKPSNAYERLELLDILEGNVGPAKIQPPKKIMNEEIFDFEEHIPSQIVNKDRSLNVAASPELPAVLPTKKRTSKLMERLTALDSKEKKVAKPVAIAEVKVKESPKSIVVKAPKTTVKNTKFVVSPPTNKPASSIMKAGPGKSVALSEKVVKAAQKRTISESDDLESYIITKGSKKMALEVEKRETASPKPKAKAKILQQTIITPAGEIIQPNLQSQATDDNVFDINSMPIVLSDEILTPESIENMPIVLGGDLQATASPGVEKILVSNSAKKVVAPTTTATATSTPNRILNKSITVSSMLPSSPNIKPVVQKSRTPRILQNLGGNKVMKPSSPLLPATTKPGKYIIVPQSSTTTPSKYSVGKRPTMIIKKPVLQSSAVPKIQNIAPEPSGNKIMIVTNQQGQQQRLLLTPAQQKMLGYQNQSSKVSKTVIKGSNLIQKSVLSKVEAAGTSSGFIKNQNIVMSPSQKFIGANSTSQTLITSSGKIIGSPQNLKSYKALGKKLQMPSQKIYMNQNKPQQKTILIKNQHGQTVRKIQGTNDALLDKQVAEQLEAIKASSSIKYQHQKPEILNYKSSPKNTLRRSYSSKKHTLVELPTKEVPAAAKILQSTPATPTVTSTPKKVEPAVPALTPLASPVKDKEKIVEATTSSATEKNLDRPLNQLVIQDAMGNQTTITEGQILALPSETVDGQPQSYMLVTLDESGNLTPLNNEALLSLDPSLVSGGDMSNMVLQIDQGVVTSSEAAVIKAEEKVVEEEKVPEKVVEATKPVATPSVVKEIVKEEVVKEVAKEVVAPLVQVPKPVVEEVLPQIEPAIVEEQVVATTTASDEGQQLIVTGDPIATQKFLESLTEGTTDLSNILANAEGGILIQADGQQILINTNADNQMLLSVNNDNLNVAESTEGGGNPMFATQPNKFQDILAAALADTDFQQEPHTAQSKIQSQLSPSTSTSLYPMNVSNVLETSLTLNSPIMTPLELPSNNSKKIPDEEADILTQLNPKNVDLPITITDPNISQTVANQQQQVTSMLLAATELQNNLELALPISESAIIASVTSVEMNSPSFVYSLPTLDDSVGINQKHFNSSMPLLTEEVEESVIEEAAVENKVDEVPEMETPTPTLVADVVDETVEIAASESKNLDSTYDLPLDHNLEIESSDTEEKSGNDVISTGGFLEEEEGLCTLGGEMCSSLSEPPPEMFDLPGGFTANKPNDPAVSSGEVGATDFVLNEEIITERGGLESNSSGVQSEDSCEIPIQPQIVTSLPLESFESSDCARDAGNVEIESNNCKFD